MLRNRMNISKRNVKKYRVQSSAMIGVFADWLDMSNKYFHHAFVIYHVSYYSATSFSYYIFKAKMKFRLLNISPLFAIIWFILIDIWWALIFVAFIIFSADISDMQCIAFRWITTYEYIKLFSFFLADHILPQSFWRVRSSPFWQEQFVYLLLWYWFLDYYSQPRSAVAGYFHPPMFDFELIVTPIICYVQFSPIL